jgi:virulence-associated protein VapD
MDRERSRLPEAQGWAERIKKAREVYGPGAATAFKKKKELLQQIKVLEDEIDTMTNAHINKHKKEYTDINEVLYSYNFYSKIRNLSEEEREKALDERDRLKKDARKKQAKLNKPLNEEIKPLRALYKELKEQTAAFTLEHRRSLYMKDNGLNMTDEEYAQAEERLRIEAELRANNNGEDMADPEMRQAMVASLMATVKKPGEKRTFTMKCPAPECRGFLNTQYICGLCERGTCAHCLTLYSEEDADGRKHECKPEDVETVKEIKKSCRNCPSCGMSIFRIEGCNQMFCTSCNTAFDWATGRELVTNQIHNPHYSEYLRKMGLDRRTVGQGQEPALALAQGQIFTDCDRLPSHRVYYINYLMFKNVHMFEFENLDEINHLSNIYRLLIEIQEEMMGIVRAELESVSDNRRINAEYLAGVYGENEWKKKLAINEASRIAYNEAHDALDAFRAVGRDIFVELAANIDEIKKPHANSNKLKKSLDELNNLRIIPDEYKKCYNNAYKQIKTLLHIYNKKILDTIRVYKIPCRVIEDYRTTNPIGFHNREPQTIYRLRLITHTGLKNTTLTEYGLHFEVPEPVPSL